MKRTASILLALVLSAAFTACDYTLTPGDDSHLRDSFADAPPATPNETNRDSISAHIDTYRPIGTGSAYDLKRSVNSGIDMSANNPNTPTKLDR